jgi:uncharacterized phage protein (TIGR02216 family)
VADNPRGPDPSPYPLPEGEGFHAATFADSAIHLAGLAGALLGWRPDELWRATPAELAAVFGAMAGGGADSASAGDLKRLMEMFPDG